MRHLRSQVGQVTGEALLIALAVALVYFVGEETVKGAKWVGHEAKVGAAKVVHVLEKVL